MKRTNFKTVIIDARIIKKIIKWGSVGIFFLFIMIISRFIGTTTQRLAISDDFYKTIISSQMHNEKSASLKETLVNIIGFDIKKPKSILAKYSVVFREEYFPKESKEKKEETEIPPNIEKPISETKINGQMKISNQTKISVNADALANENLLFSIEKNSEPQILIMHTHTTESYSDSAQNTYIANNSDRNLDENKNIVEVGRQMAEVLNNAGIKTVHDTTVHDYPSYNGAYTRALATIKANLSKYSGIKMVLDVHRDGIIKEDGTKVKVACDINGEKVAQCMFVIGSNAELTHDNWLENMKLASKLQRVANQKYNGLMRPIILREERFNQQVSIGSLIIEVGSNGNTLDEAILGGRYIADVIVELFK